MRHLKGVRRKNIETTSLRRRRDLLCGLGVGVVGELEVGAELFHCAFAEALDAFEVVGLVEDDDVGVGGIQPSRTLFREGSKCINPVSRKNVFRSVRTRGH